MCMGCNPPAICIFFLQEVLCINHVFSGQQRPEKEYFLDGSGMFVARLHLSQEAYVLSTHA
jgi:hypothetical protein